MPSAQKKKNSFYILALSQNKVTLFMCSKEDINEVNLSTLPKDLKSVSENNHIEKQLQMHSGTKGVSGNIFHGHGVGKNHNKDNILSLFRTINKSVSDYLKDKDEALVIATVGYMFPIYKEVNSYPHLSDKFIKGSPDKLNNKDLHKKGMALLFPLL